MKLYITDNPNVHTTPELHVLTTAQFARPQYHPFIAGVKWDQIDIDITNKLPTGIIKQVISHVKLVPHIALEDFTTKTMLLLCEIYTDDSPKIKCLYQRNVKECYEFIKSLGGTCL